MHSKMIFFPALLCFATGLLAQPASGPGQQSGQNHPDPAPVKVTDLLKIRSISDVALSKDGSKVTFTVTVIEADGEARWDYKYVNHIYMMPADGSAPPKELTIREGSSQAAWSPDGKQLAFVRLADGKPQIFLMPLDGGEPAQFTHFKYGAGTPKWSPDGKSILFSSNIGLRDMLRDSILNPGGAIPKWPFEQAGFGRNETLVRRNAKADPDGNPEEVSAYLENNVADKKAKVLNKLNFQDEMVVNADLSFNEYFIQDLRPGAQPLVVTHGFYRYNSAEFTPDGRQLIFTADVDSLTHPDRSLESMIYICDADGRNLRMLLGEKDKFFTNAGVSPSGKFLAFQYGPTMQVSNPQLAIMPLHGEARDMVTIPFDRAEGNFSWSPDEQYLYFTAPSNGGVPLYRVDIQTRKVEQLTDYNSGTGSYSLRANRLVFVRTDINNPFELYTADPAAKDVKRITGFNDDWIKTRQIVRPEKHEFKDNKGLTIEYWVMKPVGYTPGKKYPLLLDIHGGPSAMWGPGESSMWHEFQYFCGRGYGVVYCNPRGSGGYGQDFLRANIEDWGAGPTSDVLTALDKAVAEGWADTSRLVVSGGSYAGYLTAWIVGHDHRFKAACAQRGVYDLATFFGEGNAWRLVPLYFGGYPWDQKVRAILQRESPITYVSNITTPLIIFHGENDRRTGFVQGEMLYRSLKVLGRPVEYVRHPGATHELTRSGDNRQRIDQMLRTDEFFRRWIKWTAVR